METTHKNIEYEKIFNILNRFTKNKEVIIESINKNALPKIGVKKSFLDIGAGPGKLLKKFSPIFKYSLAIEPKENYFNQLKKEGYEVLQSKFQDADIKEQFSFVLCCHMLYHVPLIEWPMFINKVMELTAPDGIAVIVIGANRGKHYELCSYINSHYQNSGPLKAFFDEEGYQYTIEQSYGHYYSKSFEDIFEITRFSVLEDALSPEQYTKMSNQDKKRLDELIKAYVISLKNKAGNYVLEIELDFLYIHPK